MVVSFRLNKFPILKQRHCVLFVERVDNLNERALDFEFCDVYGLRTFCHKIGLQNFTICVCVKKYLENSFDHMVIDQPLV